MATKQESRPAKLLSWVCVRMLMFVARRRPELVAGYIIEKANDLAISLTMTILDREGIAHCARCPQRFALRRQGGVYLCLAHSTEPLKFKKEVMAQVA
jgi:hypothetical protein